MPMRRALDGLRILVTRPRNNAEQLIKALKRHGARPVIFPVIQIEAIADHSKLDSALTQLHQYEWVVFTSANGVELVCGRMEALSIPVGILAGRKVACIGPATAHTLEALGVQADLIPQEYVGEQLAEAMGQVAGARVLLPRAEGGRRALPDMLAKRGALVDEISIYRAVAEEPDPSAVALIRKGLDVVTLTSPSVVRHFLTQMISLGLDPFQLPGEPAMACIGPITSRAAMLAGFQPEIVATSYTVDGLVEAICRYIEMKALA